MKRTSRIQLTVSSFGSGATELINAVNSIPRHAKDPKIRIHHNKGDRPWESDTYELTIEWEDVPKPLAAT